MKNHLGSLENHKLSKIILWCEFEEITTLVPQFWKLVIYGPREFQKSKNYIYGPWEFKLGKITPLGYFGKMAKHSPHGSVNYINGPCELRVTKTKRT